MLSSTSIISSLYAFFVMETSEKRSISKIRRIENKLHIQLFVICNEEYNLSEDGRELLNNLNELFTQNIVNKANLNKYQKELMGIYYKLYLKKLKNYSQPLYKNKEKYLINFYETDKNYCEYGITFNYIKEERLYEVFIYIEHENILVSCLLAKTYANKILSHLYFYYLKFLIKVKNIASIGKIVTK